MRTEAKAMIGLLVAAMALAVARPAEARHNRYLGPHPIVAKRGGGYCYIEAPHIHAYGPDHANLYQQVGDGYVFTGDPTPFGYDGDRHTFYGTHPVATISGEPVYCLLEGPHVHAYAPPETPEFKVKGDVAFYIGPPLPVKPARIKMVNAEYRPYVDLRPVVTVEPPPEFHAEIFVPPPPSVTVSRPRVDVQVSAPGVYVAPPMPPSVTVSVPPPPHVVVTSPGFYVGAPAPHVVVGARAPRVVVGAPAPHVVVGAPGVYVGGKVHHDNGRHNGWGKHGH